MTCFSAGNSEGGKAGNCIQGTPVEMNTEAMSASTVASRSLAGPGLPAKRGHSLASQSLPAKRGERRPTLFDGVGRPMILLRFPGATSATVITRQMSQDPELRRVLWTYGR